MRRIRLVLIRLGILSPTKVITSDEALEIARLLMESRE